MTGRHLSAPLTSIQRHPSLQNRNISNSRRRESQESKESQEHIAKLAQSIAERGIQKPLDVVAMSEQEQEASGKLYWLVGGHHRFAALQLRAIESAPINLLEGEGFQQARKHSYLQNDELFRALQDDQRICNAWRALNDPSISDFREMTGREIAAVFNLTERTTQRMKEVRRRWAAKQVEFDYEKERSLAKAQGQKGIRTFNQLLDDYCLEHLQSLYNTSYNTLKKELERGTEEATIEERAKIQRTIPAVLEALGAYGLTSKAALIAVLDESLSILSKSKNYFEACDTAGMRVFNSPQSNLERFYREQQAELEAGVALAYIGEKPDF